MPKPELVTKYVNGNERDALRESVRCDGPYDFYSEIVPLLNACDCLDKLDGGRGRHGLEALAILDQIEKASDAATQLTISLPRIRKLLKEIGWR